MKKKPNSIKRIAGTGILLAHLALGASTATESAYKLAPDDSVRVSVVDLPELSGAAVAPLRVDHQGDITLPIAGTVHTAGLTVDELQSQVAAKLRTVMQNPEVTVSIVEYRSHPVSVFGAVKNPGVYQVSGKKSLYEVLSLAGGLNADAGNKVKITRSLAVGDLPLPSVEKDSTGRFAIGELNVREVMEAKVPEDNIEVLSTDVVTVPKAELVYVVGAVRRSGGFPLTEKEQISVLQAVSLAEGLDRVASAKNARVLRVTKPGAERTEMKVDLSKILDGRAQDFALQANDILFIPTSMAKSTSVRALEAAVQVGTGIAVFGR